MTTEEIGEKRAAALGLLYSSHNATYNYPSSMAGGTTSQQKWYRATDVHALLGEGRAIYGYANLWDWGTDEHRNDRYDQPNQSAYMIGLRPIDPPSREEEMEALLRELCEKFGTSAWRYNIIDKAKKLLERTK